MGFMELRSPICLVGTFMAAHSIRDAVQAELGGNPRSEKSVSLISNPRPAKRSSSIHERRPSQWICWTLSRCSKSIMASLMPRLRRNTLQD